MSVWARQLGRVGCVLGAALISANAFAQGGVGAGPLTSSLADKEPTEGVIKLGPLRMAPGLTLSEVGHDDNVFDEASNPKKDWVVSGLPDLSLFARLRWVQFSVYGGVPFQYYDAYKTERSIGSAYRGRADILLSRLSPFIGGGRTRTRSRPNGEIDTRADQQIDEASGGIAYELFAHGQMFVSMIRTQVDFKDALQSGISLGQSLSRRSDDYQVGVRTQLTPLLTMQVHGSYREDRFRNDLTRNGQSMSGSATFTFDAAAVVSGSASVSYQDYKPDDPTVERFRGVTGSGFITYPFLEIGRFNFGYNRSREYSFDAAEAYYIENTGRAIYTHRLFGDVDLQAQASRSYFNYGAREGTPHRQDWLETYNGNLGYNLKNRTRVAANYEYAERHSRDIAQRNYIRRRIYLSWMVAF